MEGSGVVCRVCLNGGLWGGVECVGVESYGAVWGVREWRVMGRCGMCGCGELWGCVGCVCEWRVMGRCGMCVGGGLWDCVECVWVVGYGALWSTVCVRVVSDAAV